LSDKGRVFRLENIAGDTRAKTDAEGRFSLRVLKGLKGTLSNSTFFYIGQFTNCPKLEALIRKSGQQSASINSSSVDIVADRDIYNIELTFPFPSCKKKN